MEDIFDILFTFIFEGSGRARKISCLVLLVIVLGVVGFIAVSYISEKQAEQAALNQFGAGVVNLCDNLYPQLAVQADLAGTASAKLTFLDASLKTVEKTYTNALPAERNAKDKSDVTGVVCLATAKTVVGEPDTYSDSSSSKKYTCTRYQQLVNAYLVDTTSAKLANYKQFTGTIPPNCPDKLSENTDLTGDPPDASPIVQWAAGTPQ